jgi:hypothetical protein
MRATSGLDVQDRRHNTIEHAYILRLTNKQESELQSEAAMSTRLSQTIESLHEMQRVDLSHARIGDDGVETLANALKENTTVTEINLTGN